LGASVLGRGASVLDQGASVLEAFFDFLLLGFVKQGGTGVNVQDDLDALDDPGFDLDPGIFDLKASDAFQGAFLRNFEVFVVVVRMGQLTLQTVEVVVLLDDTFPQAVDLHLLGTAQQVLGLVMET
jgi:hypothetical protein